MLPYKTLRQATLKWFCSVIAIIGLLTTALSAQDARRIIIDSNVTYQQLEGFGTSGAWWAPRVGLWEQAKRQRVLTLLYDREQGAGLTIYRYHIGAGGRDELLADWRRVPCIEVTPGVYDTSRDPGIQIAKEALAAGAQQVFAFACSPPGRLTVSGKVVANKDQKQSNLAPKNYQAYSDYLCDIVNLLRQEGLPIAGFSPINEPQWAWDSTSGEGIHLKPKELVAFLRVFVERAQDRLPEVSLEVFDSGAWNETAKYLEAILADPLLPQVIDSYSVHSYWATDEYRRSFMQWAQERKFNESLHMTEWCEMKWGRSPGMDSACVLATTVISDLTICNVHSWCSWLGASPFDFRDALITVDEQGNKIETNKRLWALANFSRFIRPGWTRIEATGPDDIRMVAAKKPQGTEIVCVVVNALKQDQSVTLVGKNGQPLKVEQTWVTSESHDLQSVELPRQGDSLSLPPQSVVSIVISNSN